MREIASNRPFFPREDIRGIKVQVGEILESGQLSNGPYVKELELRFAARVGVKYAIAVSSGTAALEIIYRWMGVHNQDVLIPTNTFIATPNAAYYAGGRPYFVDINEKTLCVNKASLPLGGYGAVTLVHIGGYVTPDIEEICERYEGMVVEDAAHAHGSTERWSGHSVGSFGVAAAFSFYPTKTLTSGEGGIITTNREELDSFARSVRDQGRSPENGDLNIHWGHNWRMSEIHALLGLYQLKRLDDFLIIRRAIAKIYDEELKGVISQWLRPLEWDYGQVHALYKYVVFLEPRLLKKCDRDQFKKLLREEKGLRLPGEVYAIPCHRQPIYSSWRKVSFPEADKACDSHICLPIHAAMTLEDARYVVDCLRRVIVEL